MSAESWSTRTVDKEYGRNTATGSCDELLNFVDIHEDVASSCH